MEDKMAAGAFGRDRNYGLDDPFNVLRYMNFVSILSTKVFYIYIFFSALIPLSKRRFVSNSKTAQFWP